MKNMYKFMILVVLMVTLGSCEPSTILDRAVRKDYEGKNVWINRMSACTFLVLTKDSFLVQVECRGTEYPYISERMVLGKFGKKR